MAAPPRLTVAEVVEILEARFGPALPDRDFAPLDELVSCILSQHSNDARTYPAFAALKERYPTYESLMASEPAEIETLLKPAGLARAKTQRMRSALAEIHRRVGAYDIGHLGQLSDRDALAWLESLPGVGPKTAAVTLAFAFGRDVLPVDTHVFRVAKRLGWISERVTEAKAHPLLAKKTPQGLARRTHLLLIRHGRTLCHARKPLCDACPFAARCRWAISYHHSSSAKPLRPKRMSQPVASSETFELQRKLHCFAGLSHGPAIVRAIDRAQGASFWPAIEADPKVASRVARLWTRAPEALVEVFADSELARAMLGGSEVTSTSLDAVASPTKVVGWARRERLRCLLTDDGGSTMIFDGLVRHALRRLSLSIQPVAVGDWALQAVTESSPLRLLCFGSSSTVIEEVTLLQSWFDGLRRHGLHGEPVEAVAWTEEAFIKYELEHMPMSERYRYVSARAVNSNDDMERLVRKVAFALPLTPERLRELVAMRTRETTEAMRSSHRWRHVALGLGGLADLLWIVQVYELRYPTATQAGTRIDVPERIRTLARSQLINALERDEMLEAWGHLRAVRSSMQWLGMTPDIMPENPAKLARLALVFGYDDGNRFLDYHEKVTRFVRGMVEESMERLRA